MSQAKQTGSVIPAWAVEFHGHACPFMPIGYRMGILAMKELGVEREKDHSMFALSEMGEGHPNTCMNDGIQVATGCTFGKLLMDRLNYGKLAFILYKKDKGAVRVSVKSDFIDLLGKQGFAILRKSGKEPSEIPTEISASVIGMVLNAQGADMFKIERLADFEFERPLTRFNKGKCSLCGEYVFERYLRVVDGKLTCIPCSGYTESKLKV
ncbi:MAG: TraR/DksA C4-type zinc finger protein [Nitrososphaerota archaeon]|nr:TraR/DksA C4-type zinc finger protein [Nitrososphaerota archaeon]MDG6924338.1 TraR/DksA C4-type zinc finger protein [Nitrososphaerota archaeon]